MAGWSTMLRIVFYGSEKDLGAVDNAFLQKKQALEDAGEYDSEFWGFLDVYDLLRHRIEAYQNPLAEAYQMKLFFKELKSNLPNLVIRGETRMAFMGGDYEEINIKVFSEEGSTDVTWEETYKLEDDYCEEE